ncbi:Bug family tripartite tricarboxylate transporter substrate binding protein [Allopusillimonas ginsengisoli]|uniref:Bug family tripartite tricarboxylate transporter substrate binding protein n=1 Tax=Allopusillimonas ginsengisoli TaxID=453575 RepID=UPI001021909F|nr:tripartite tricarboxylate transporter substrate binding protein [Allopusillimonas ginsengisoli]TEA76859.1 tripartite tricarboxylate transporter substrate binding protein [Allopusillimonas ginsengisoli]
MITFTSRLFLAFALCVTSAWAHDFPSKPIRIVVPYSPGGGTDIVARLMGDRLSTSLKQPVIVENRAGASANIGTEFVARAPADGYTVLVTAPNFTTSEALFDKLGWKFDDFTPVIQLTRYSNVLVAAPGSPVSTMQEVIDQGKANPDSLNFGSAGTGANAHLVMELLSLRTGAVMQHIPYKGSGPLKTDLLGGHVQLGADGLAGLSDAIEAGKLKALAVLSPQRSPLAPEIPSLGDIGIHDVDANGWSGALVPAGTPPEVVAILQKAFAQALQDPETITRLRALGFEPAGGSSEAFLAYLSGERTKWAEIIKAKHIKPE